MASWLLHSHPLCMPLIRFPDDHIIILVSLVPGKRLAFINADALTTILRLTEAGISLIENCSRPGVHALCSVDHHSSCHGIGEYQPKERAHWLFDDLFEFPCKDEHCSCAKSAMIAGWLLRMANAERSIEEFQAIHNGILEKLRVSSA